uniref:Uncharacterized protein n=1 Tax=Panagrolaimus superbus TaxID=310955 RepID=A0A914YQB8_9BILA
MKEIQPLWFTPLFQRYIEGEIQFYANITQLEYEEFAKYRDEDNEYIVDIGIAVKEFNIHDEFYFEFQLRD